MSTLPSRAATFVDRHVGPGESAIAEMLAAIGATSLDQLVAEALPKSIRFSETLPIGGALSEAQALARLKSIAGRNEVFTSLIGQGYHGTFLPPVIARWKA